MEQPVYILENGTRVVTANVTENPGYFVHPENLYHRRPGQQGVIAGVVGGHGGDVYWVNHDPIPGMKPEVAAYGWWELEYAPPVEDKAKAKAKAKAKREVEEKKKDEEKPMPPVEEDGERYLFI